jgi:hypothetical protein
MSQSRKRWPVSAHRAHPSAVIWRYEYFQKRFIARMIVEKKE